MAPRRAQSEHMLSLLERHKIQVLLDAEFSAAEVAKPRASRSTRFDAYGVRAQSLTPMTSWSTASAECAARV
jgi:hypothetical protein